MRYAKHNNTKPVGLNVALNDENIINIVALTIKTVSSSLLWEGPISISS